MVQLLRHHQVEVVVVVVAKAGSTAAPEHLVREDKVMLVDVVLAMRVAVAVEQVPQAALLPQEVPQVAAEVQEFLDIQVLVVLAEAVLEQMVLQLVEQEQQTLVVAAEAYVMVLVLDLAVTVVQA
jgi:hypothetical protein